MAYKIVLTNHCAIKLTTIFDYLEKNFSENNPIEVMKKIDRIVAILEHLPELSTSSTKIPGIYKISITGSNKLFYQVKGRKIILLDILFAKTATE